jgi:hypothetical protein
MNTHHPHRIITAITEKLRNMNLLISSLLLLNWRVMVMAVWVVGWRRRRRR